MKNMREIYWKLDAIRDEVRNLSNGLSNQLGELNLLLLQIDKIATKEEIEKELKP